MSKLKILFISEYFYPHGIGGGERSALKLAEALTRKGCEVHVLTSKVKDSLPCEKYKDITIWRRLKTSKTPNTYFDNVKRMIIFERSVLKETKKLHKEIGFDVIHCKNATSIGAIYLRPFIKARFVIHINSYVLLCPKGTMVYRDRDMNRKRVCDNRCSLIDFNICMKDSNQVGNLYLSNKEMNNILFKTFLKLKNIYNKWLLKKFDKYIALSNQVKQQMIRLGYDEKKITVIYPILEVKQ